VNEVRISLLDEGEPVLEPEATHDLPERREPEIRALRLPPEDVRNGAAAYEVTVDGWVLRYRVEDEVRSALREGASRGSGRAVEHSREHVRARIPGRVTRVWVVPGQKVALGERLLAIEAMKMENEIRASRAGVIAAIAVEPGMAVELNADLLTLD
jgi:biotin carboxyl carrier protein